MAWWLAGRSQGHWLGFDRWFWWGSKVGWVRHGHWRRWLLDFRTTSWKSRPTGQRRGLRRQFVRRPLRRRTRRFSPIGSRDYIPSHVSRFTNPRPISRTGSWFWLSPETRIVGGALPGRNKSRLAHGLLARSRYRTIYASPCQSRCRRGGGPRILLL